MATQREWLQLVKESSYRTKMTSPVAGTDAIFLSLTESNAFTPFAAPDLVETPYGGGFDAPVDALADSHTVVGRLQTLVYPAQAAFLLGWALSRVNAGQTLPWPTTEPPGDLASVTGYHGVPRGDGTIARKKLTGGKVAALELSCSRQDPRLKCAMDVVFSEVAGHAAAATSDPDATEAPAPTEASYATGSPFLFSHTAGALSYNGSALTQYESLTIRVQNTLDPRKWESKWVQTCACNGRKASLSAVLRLKASPNLRADLETSAKRSLSVAFANGANTLTIAFNGKNVPTALPYDLPLGKEFTQALTLTNLWDRAAPGDVSFTYA